MLAHKIIGTANQMAVVELGPGRSCYGDRGTFRWKTGNVSMQTRLTTPPGGRPGAPGSGGGLFGELLTIGKRMLGGEGVAFQYYQADTGTGLVGFAGSLPGELRAVELDGSVGWYAERGALLAAEGSVGFDIAFTGMRQGALGHAGYVLQHLTGAGTVFLAGAGNFIELDLAKYGGVIQAETGIVVGFQDTVQYSVEQVGMLSGQTAMTAVFGGEGLYMATFRGQGTVMLQSTSVHALGDALGRAIQHEDNRPGPLDGLGL